MAYYVTNTKPRLIMGFVCGVTVIADDRYEELHGKGDDVSKLTNPQRFFRDQIACKNLVVSAAKSKTTNSSDPVELVAGMSVAEASKFCSDCGDPRVLKQLIDSDKRAKVVKAAEKKLDSILENDDKED
jgi:hypothetical protein